MQLLCGRRHLNWHTSREARVQEFRVEFFNEGRFLMNDFQSPNQRYNPQQHQQQAWSPPGAEGGWGSLQAQSAAQASVEERMGFIRKVYALFFVGTLFAIGGVALGMSFPPLFEFAAEHPFIMLLVMLGAVMGASAVRHVPVVNVVALFAFTTFTGVVISPLMFYVYQVNPASIWQAGVLTVGIFGGLTAYVFISKRDFSFLRGMLWTGLIIMILGGLLNVFIVGSSALGFGLAAATLPLFSE